MQLFKLFAAYFPVVLLLSQGATCLPVAAGLRARNELAARGWEARSYDHDMAFIEKRTELPKPQHHPLNKLTDIEAQKATEAKRQKENEHAQKLMQDRIREHQQGLLKQLGAQLGVNDPKKAQDPLYALHHANKMGKAAHPKEKSPSPPVLSDQDMERLRKVKDAAEKKEDYNKRTRTGSSSGSDSDGHVKKKQK